MSNKDKSQATPNEDRFADLDRPTFLRQRKEESTTDLSKENLDEPTFIRNARREVTRNDK